MTDTTLPPDGGAGDRIEPVDIQQEMQSSYIDYAMSVIVGRALPDVRDGLKPVHRRVLYAMYDNGFRPDRGYVKSARAVAETMGNYHPHGDASIYDTLVRLAQPWSMRYPLVDGQGNFGSRGNDGAAAMRYCVTGDALVRLPRAVRSGSRTWFRSEAEQRQPDRREGDRPARELGACRCAVPLRYPPHADGANQGRLRTQRHRQPPAAVLGRCGGRSDPAVEVDRGDHAQVTASSFNAFPRRVAPSETPLLCCWGFVSEGRRATRGAADRRGERAPSCPPHCA